MSRIQGDFFRNAPSHKPIAWVGAVAGLFVLALAGVAFPNAHPLFTLAILCVGLAEFGWAAELLPRHAPRHASRLAGWARAARWLAALLAALLGTLLAVVCLIAQLTPEAWFGLVIAGTGALLALEMAPNDRANRP